MKIAQFYLEDRHGGRRRSVWSAAPWERVEARGVIASSIALAALAAASTAGGMAVSAGIQSHAAGSAAATSAKATSDATAQQLQYEREATAAQQKAAAEQLAYARQQSALSRQDAETNREGDYEQWAAREGRLSTIGGMLGLPARQIPAYRPLGPDGGGDAGGSADGAARTGGVYDAIRAYQTDPNSKAANGIEAMRAALKAKGYNVDRFMYGATPSNNELIVNGEKFKVIGGEDSPASAYFYMPGMNDAGGRGARGSIRTMAPARTRPLGAAPGTIRQISA